MSSDLFFECLAFSTGTGIITSKTVTKQALAVIFVGMLLKRMLISGTKSVDFTERGKNDYYKLYKELINSVPSGKTARRIRWPEALARCKKYLAAKEPDCDCPSSLNDLLHDSGNDSWYI
ncbi:unnamed protein product [Absidia cylindrospora]